MIVKPTIAGQQWLASADVHAVLDALGTARLVGGCVRNSLLGLPVDDIDIATPLTPDAVAKAVEARGMKAIDTGAEHGTVTVVLNSLPYEVTTLRRDVSTDGRRATVAFTTVWEEDAARRDFTINALYADGDGRVHDYHQGLADLEAGVVRFIGDADTRIAEDHLRILRLFRIHAWYGRGEIDAEALRACRSGRGRIQALSGERIQKEMMKLLRARKPGHAVRAMRDTHVLEEIIPGHVDLDVLSRMSDIDEAHHLEPEGILRLGTLIPAGDSARQLAQRWRLSNDDRARLVNLFKLFGLLEAPVDRRAFRRLLYRHGPDAVCDQIRLAWARGDAVGDGESWKTLMGLARSWSRPVLGVDGADVLRAGVPEGPQVGRVLGEVEAWWIDADFPDDVALVKARLRDVVDGLGRR
jgi:poly(A) polymerase